MRFSVLRFEVKLLRRDRGYDFEVRMRSKILRFLAVLVQMAKFYGKIVNFCQEFMLEKSFAQVKDFIRRNTYMYDPIS